MGTGPYFERQEYLVAGAKDALKQPKGIYLQVAPTGSGKTYCIANAFAELLAEDEDFRVIYVTPQRKNRNDFDAELDKALKKRGIDGVEPCNLLSNIDAVKQALRDGTPKPFPDGINDKNLEESYDELKAQYDTIRKIEKSTAITKGMRDGLGAEFKRAERQFRRALSRAFQRSYRTEESKRRRIGESLTQEEFMLSEEGWSNIATFYPSARLEFSRVVMMTPQKLVNRCDRVIRGWCYLYNPSFLKGWTVVFDEPDKIKKEMLTALCSTEDSQPVDPFALVKNLSESLETTEFTAELQRDAGEKWLDVAYEITNGELGNVKGHGIYQDLELNRRFTVDDRRFTVNESLRKPYMAFFTKNKNMGTILTKGKLNSLRVVSDDLTNSHVIFLPDSSEKKDNRGKSFAEFFRRASGALRTLVGRSLLYGARNITIQKQRIDPTFTLEEAIRTIVSELGLENGEQWVQLVLQSGGQSGDDSEKGLDILPDNSFYAKGIDFCELDWSDDHYTMAYCKALIVKRTPESILLNMASAAPVLLVGATAMAEMAGNFDLEYLNDAEGSAGFVNYAGGVENFEQIRRCTALYNRECEEAYRVVVEEERDYLAEIDDRDLNTLLLNMNDGRDHFRKAMNACAAFNRAMRIGAGAGIAFFPFAMRKDEAEKVERACCEWLQYEPFERFYAVTENWENETGYAGFKAAVEAGRKALLITTYPTASTGRNMQVRNSGAFPTVVVGDYQALAGDNRDLDFLYCDFPTNSLTQPESCRSDESGSRSEAKENLLVGISETEELYERSEISYRDSVRREDVFGRAFMGASNKAILPTRELPSNRVAAARMINQATGRLNRTQVKSPVVTIVLSKDTLINTDFAAFDDTPTTREWEAVAEFGKRWQNENMKEAEANTQKSRFERTAERANRQADGFIRNFLQRKQGGGLDEKRTEQWKQERYWCLKNPSTNDAEGKRRRFYLVDSERNDATHYWYAQRSDFKEIKVSMDGPIKEKELGWEFGEVSDEAARLDIVRKIPELREHWEKKGYATRIEPARYLLSPIEFNNIYKGAIGEECVEAFMERYFPEVTLDDLSDDPEKFETVDYRLYGKTYIDAKNYKPTESGGEIDSEKAQAKLESLDADRILYINAFGRSSWGHRITPACGGRILMIPYLYDMDTLTPSFEAIKMLKDMMRHER